MEIQYSESFLAQVAAAPLRSTIYDEQDRPYMVTSSAYGNDASVKVAMPLFQTMDDSEFAMPEMVSRSSVVVNERPSRKRRSRRSRDEGLEAPVDDVGPALYDEDLRDALVSLGVNPFR